VFDVQVERPLLESSLPKELWTLGVVAATATGSLFLGLCLLLVHTAFIAIGAPGNTHRKLRISRWEKAIVWGVVFVFAVGIMAAALFMDRGPYRGRPDTIPWKVVVGMWLVLMAPQFLYMIIIATILRPADAAKQYKNPLSVAAAALSALSATFWLNTACIVDVAEDEGEQEVAPKEPGQVQLFISRPLSIVLATSGLFHTSLMIVLSVMELVIRSSVYETSKIVDLIVQSSLVVSMIRLNWYIYYVCKACCGPFHCAASGGPPKPSVQDELYLPGPPLGLAPAMMPQPGTPSWPSYTTVPVAQVAQNGWPLGAPPAAAHV
jgi:hypothetical protein